MPAGQFLIQKVVPQATGESSKVKVKVRVNIHGIFSVSSASLVEVQKSDESEEPMETEQVSDKDGEVILWNYCCLSEEAHILSQESLKRRSSHLISQIIQTLLSNQRSKSN